VPTNPSPGSARPFAPSRPSTWKSALFIGTRPGERARFHVRCACGPQLVEFPLRRRLAPILFTTMTAPGGGHRQRSRYVAPQSGRPQPNAGGLTRTDDGLPVHASAASFERSRHPVCHHKGAWRQHRNTVLDLPTTPPRSRPFFELLGVGIGTSQEATTRKPIFIESGQHLADRTNKSRARISPIVLALGARDQAA